MESLELQRGSIDLIKRVIIVVRILVPGLSISETDLLGIFTHNSIEFTQNNVEKNKQKTCNYVKEWLFELL